MFIHILSIVFTKLTTVCKCAHCCNILSKIKMKSSFENYLVIHKFSCTWCSILILLLGCTGSWQHWWLTSRRSSVWILAWGLCAFCIVQWRTAVLFQPLVHGDRQTRRYPARISEYRWWREIWLELSIKLAINLQCLIAISFAHDKCNLPCA